MSSLIAVVLVIAGTVIGSFGAIFLKKGSTSLTLQPKELAKNRQLLLGLFLYGLSTIPFIIALKYGQVSILYPITSLTNIWVCLLSPLMLGENMNLTKWAGIALIINGVISIST